MENLETVMEAACKDHTIPGAVLQAVNKNGTFKYSKAFGSCVAVGQPDKPLPVDAVFRIASCSKLMTSIAALQCVERGQIGLDDDIANILPEIVKLPVLTRFSEQGKPEVEPRKGTITLRRMLSHSSGLSYPPFDPRLQQYITAINEPSLYTAPAIAERYGTTPLVFHPGTEWMYSPAIDFAGKLVERLNDNISLEDYLKKHVWEPLGIKDITFFADKRPDMTDRMAGMTERSADGTAKAANSFGNDDLGECYGGQGLYATLPDYLKVLQSILVDDEKLLKKETCHMMMQPHLEEGPKKSFDIIRATPASMFSFFPGEWPDSEGLDYGLSGMVTTSDEPGWRGKGTLTWSGYPNLFWFVDRQNELCGIFGTQVTPPGDKPIAKLITLFEKTMQQRAKDS